MNLRGRTSITCLLVLLALFKSNTTSAAAATYIFAHIEWGLPPESYRIRLEDRGYTFRRWSPDSSFMIFDGTLDGKNVEVWAMVASSAVENVRVMFDVGAGDYNDAKDLFDELKTDLIAKYGRPTTCDIRIAGSVPDDFCRWHRANDSGALDIENELAYTVISYESPKWASYMKSRDAQEKKDF
jgi:hypothetical protein